MKRVLLVVLILLSVTLVTSAEGINLGDFPLGKWLDANWDAVWEFRSDNIRILSPAGEVLYDFADKNVTDFSVKPSTGGLVLSFKCAEANRSYQFTKPLTNMNLKMVIVKGSGAPYEVELPFQR